MEAAETQLLATFEVRQTLCALEAEGVQEVIRLGALTEVHHAPPEVIGVLNLRGRIVTILDLGVTLGFGPIARSPENRVFVVVDRNEYIGLLVDRAGQVMEVDAGDREPAPANLPPEQSRFFQGVHRVGQQVVALVDIDQVLVSSGQ